MISKILFAFICLVAWLTVFCFGAFVDTNPMRAHLRTELTLNDFVLVMISWIPTNLAFLSILSGLFGSLCRNLLRSVEVGTVVSPMLQAKRIMYGTISGFVLYLIAMAGAYLIMDNPFETTTPEQYFKTAGVISLLTFAAGFRPDRQFLRQ
jgi:hypothetical protein